MPVTVRRANRGEMKYFLDISAGDDGKLDERNVQGCVVIRGRTATLRLRIHEALLPHFEARSDTILKRLKEEGVPERVERLDFVSAQ